LPRRFDSREDSACSLRHSNRELAFRNSNDDVDRVRVRQIADFKTRTYAYGSAGPSGFQLSLQLELETNDGQTITVSGSVSVSNCAVRQVQSACGGGFS